MSARSLNWLKFGGLVALAFVPFLIHWRFLWSQFRLVRPQTGEVLFLLETGQGGFGGVEAVVKRMVAEIKLLYQ